MSRAGTGWLVAAGVFAFSLGSATARAGDGLLAGAAARELSADDSLVIGGGIGPGKARGQEGKLRACALVVEDRAGSKVCLVACDVLMVARDVLDRAARRVEAGTGIPFDHVLINATHTHHAPTTVTVHGYRREEAFTKQVEDAVVAAAEAASKRLTPVELFYRRGEESSVGRNSRLLLSDGTIFWTGRHDDAVRPTGPFDPDLPVLAFRRPGGAVEAVLFNHSTHTIGTHEPGVRSPSFYGLAAQGLEAEQGGTFLFFSGASGSTHNLDLPAKEATLRIRAAVEDALAVARPRAVGRVTGRRKEVTLRVRHFDEAKDDAAVSSYTTKRVGEVHARPTIEVFRAMRKVLAPQQGHERKTWVQAVLIGDIALVGVPGEFFTLLGEDIKRRSPYRDTFVFQLANDYVGYIPDRRAFDRGGYQVWTGLHSYLEKGSGETIVDEAVGLLDALHAASGPAPGG
jgi:neutral ceramidase